MGTPESNGSALAQAVFTARLDPQWFVRHVLRNVDSAGQPLNDPWLDELLEAIADLWRADMGLPTRVNHELKNLFSIRSGHGPGKTFGIAEIMHYVGFCWESQFVCIAPKEKLVLTRLWPRFRTIYMKSIAEYRELIDIRESKIIWNKNRNWVAIPETADQPESLAGYHTNGPNDWLIVLVDETSGVREDFFPVIHGMLSSPHTILIMISNPTQTQGEFYKSHRDPKVARDYFAKHIKYGESRYTKAKWEERMRIRYGVNSPIYQVRVLGEFVEMSENQLISMDWLNGARLRSVAGDGSHPKLRISVDVSDGGESETSITGAHHYDTTVNFLKQRNHSDPPSKAPILAGDHAIEMFKELKGDRKKDDFVVDANGVGAGTAGYLIQKGYRVISYRGGADSDNPKKWRNRRVQSTLVFRNALRDGWLSIDENFVNDEDWDDFVAQATCIKRKPGNERVEDIETKADLLARELASPDRFESAVMQFATQAPLYGGTQDEGTGQIIDMNKGIGNSEAADANW